MAARPLCSLVIAVLAMPAALAAQKTLPPPAKTVPDSVSEIWVDMEQSFVALADAMPEDKWAFKPTQGEFKDARTFADQVKHVACANEAWPRSFAAKSLRLVAILADRTRPRPKPRSWPI
jgi:hypothetical protein